MLVNGSNSNSSGSPMSPLSLVLICIAFIIVIFFFIFIKKLYYRFKYKKRYFIFPKTSVKGITNIAMVVSIAVTAIILLTIITAGFMAVLFRAYPGWRVTIEGILIKIGGLLFGPIIGICVGAATDLLSIALTAGIFHYGYFITAMLYGLISGIVRSLYNISRDKNVIFSFLSIVMATAIFALSIGYISMIKEDSFSMDLFGFSISISKSIVLLISGLTLVFGIGSIWVCLLIYDRYELSYWWKKTTYWFKYSLKDREYSIKSKKMSKQAASNLHLKKYSGSMFNRAELNAEIAKIKRKIDDKHAKGNNWFSYLAQVICVVVTTETLVDIIILPIFDNDLSPLGFSYWEAFRVIVLIPMTFLNLLTIYPVYRIVAPSMNYDYKSDIVEDISTPLIYK